MDEALKRRSRPTVATALGVCAVVMCLAGFAPHPAGAGFAFVGFVMLVALGGWRMWLAARCHTGPVRLAWQLFAATAVFIAAAGGWVASAGGAVVGALSGTVVLPAAFGVVSLLAAFGVVVMSSHSLTQAWRRFVDYFTLGGALTMLMWATPYGPAATADSLLSVWIHSFQLAGVCALFSVAAVHLWSKPGTGGAWWPSVGWSVLLIGPVSMIVADCAGQAWSPAWASAAVGAGVLLTTVGYQRRWPIVPSPPGRYRGAVANVLLLVAMVALVLPISHSGRFAAVGVGQIIVMTAIVLLRNHIATLEVTSLVRQLRARERQLIHEASHDALTGLLNRGRFDDLLGELLNGTSTSSFAVVFIDVDRFKAINDSFGHHHGDRVLQMIAERLQSLEPQIAHAARISGDEFAAVIPDASCADDAVARLHRSVREPMLLFGAPLHVTASIGATVVHPSCNVTAEDVMARADMAMYSVKSLGRDGFAFHDSHIPQPLADDRVLAPALASRLGAGDLDVMFQPFFHIHDGQLAGFEVLPHWVHDGKVITAARFTALADRAGLARAAANQLWEVAIRQLGDWQRVRPRLRLEVRIRCFAALFAEESMVQHLVGLLAGAGMLPGQVVLEVGDDDLGRHADVVGLVMANAHRAGFQVAVHDFGVGSNAASQMLAMAVSKVKLGAPTVQGIEHDEVRARAVAGLIGLAAHRGIQVIADGVNGADQLQILRALGVDFVQGPHVGSPDVASAWTGLVASADPLAAVVGIDA